MIQLMSRLPVLLTVLLLARCSIPPPSYQPPSSAPASARGYLLIVGGGEQPPELVRHFVELAGGPGSARIAVIPSASGSPEESGRDKVEDFARLGARAFSLELTRAQAEGDSATRLLDGVTGVWFTGGDQARLTRVFLGTPVLAAIHRRYREGAVIGGTSAGAAVMSDSMITGNQFRPGVDTAGYYEDQFPRVARHAIEIRPGFGFLRSAIVDQHFLRRERHNRLLSATLEHPRLLGVGIDEATALQVEPGGGWTVLGRSAVIVYDAHAAQITPPGAPVLGALGLRVQLLPAGSSYDPRTGKAKLPSTSGSPG